MEALLPNGINGSFEDRFRRLGADIDVEVRRSVESAVRSSTRETHYLRMEIEQLRDQLDAERQQSAARLSHLAELQEQLEACHEAHQQEMHARDYWQLQCAGFDEKHGLLEAKLAALELEVAEEAQSAREARAALAKAVRPGRGRNGAQAALRPRAAELEPEDESKDEQAEEERDREEQKELESEGENCTAAGVWMDDVMSKVGDQGGDWARPDELQDLRPGHRRDSRKSSLEDCNELDLEGCPLLDVSSAAAIEKCLKVLEDSSSSFIAERQLRAVSAEGMHGLLVAVAGRSDSKGVSFLLHRITRLWVGRLLNRNGGSAIKAAVKTGSMEALTALLSLGGTPAALSALSEDCPLSLAAERGDVAMLTTLLEHLRGAGQEIQSNARRARSLAMSRGHVAAAAVLTSHLVVELSLRGNNWYRQGEFERAIQCYEEAIIFSTECDRDGDSRLVEDGCKKENLVRLRYNLARALHRTDRWAEARQQSTIVLTLDGSYVNAYALRAQACMAALDWHAACADWDQLLLFAERGWPAAAPIGEEVASAWRRRRQECLKQMTLNHYEALGLMPLSDIEAAKRAYRELAKRWHPDKHQHKSIDHQDRATRRFARVREAYEVLSAEASKVAYDTQLTRSFEGPSTGLEAPRRSQEFRMSPTSDAASSVPSFRRPR